MGTKIQRVKILVVLQDPVQQFWHLPPPKYILKHCWCFSFTKGLIISMQQKTHVK